jgi:TonB family protein
MLEMNSRTQLATPQGEFANQQNNRLLIALTLLLVALVVVLVKDREFWFGSFEAAESSASDSESISNSNPVAAPAKTSQAPVAKAATTTKQLASKTSTHAVTDASHKDAASATTNPAGAASPVVATNRVVLPPLDVEVIAGDSHRMVHSGSNVAKVQIPSDSKRAAAVTATMTHPTNAAGHERITAAVPELHQTVETTYPLLGKNSRVQGSVVLQAIVGADGNIENLRVLSGPAVLATAAQQAVRQWRFKPVIENGQAVETKAKITVNFSIRISDDANAS